MNTSLRDIMLTGGVKSVLDLGAGMGLNSLYCTSFGADVTAIDKKDFPEYLKGHPKIKLLNDSIESLSWGDGHYDLVILNSVIPFLTKDFFKEKLVPAIMESLNPGGFVYISAFLPNDPVFSKNSKASLYSAQELLDIFSTFSMVEKEEKSVNDNHPPLGPHEHQIVKIVFKKK